MPLVTIDRERCTRDGLCLRSCARALLSLDEDAIPTLPPEKEARCTRCGHCAAVCPSGAIHVEVAEGERIIPLQDGNRLRVEQADQLLRSCRSVRRFRPNPVPGEEIAAILEAARLAPSGGNNQMVRWAVLQDRSAVARAADMVAEWFDTVARHNPRHASRYAIDNILTRYRSGNDIILRGAPNAVLAYTDDKAAWGPVDSAIAMTYFNLAGHARGIGSCWGGYLTRAIAEYPPLRDFLCIPERNTVHCSMVFGYPDIMYHAIPVRNPVQVSWI